MSCIKLVRLGFRCQRVRRRPSSWNKSNESKQKWIVTIWTQKRLSVSSKRNACIVTVETVKWTLNLCRIVYRPVTSSVLVQILSLIPILKHTWSAFFTYARTDKFQIHTKQQMKFYYIFQYLDFKIETDNIRSGAERNQAFSECTTNLLLGPISTWM